ncbi:MAG TPA: helix-turn-helix transcriptional regulator [Blastocatellia bacterium]|nr:helix-turn-helix transcriptional regulator [Blastocatellia bacterium]
MAVRLIVRKLAVRQGFANARELAAQAGLSPSVVYPYWNDSVVNINRQTLERLADALGLPEPGTLIVRDRPELEEE